MKRGPKPKPVEKKRTLSLGMVRVNSEELEAIRANHTKAQKTALSDFSQWVRQLLLKG